MVEEKIKSAIEKVKPMLQADGGDIEFISFANGVVKVRLRGSCAGCPMSQMTLKNGVERILKKEVSEVTSVESV